MMNRRTLLAGSAALAGAVSIDEEAAADLTHERPPFDITPDGAEWRIRSWEWSQDAWRPLVGRGRIVASDIQIDGHVAQGDYAAICAGLMRRYA